MLVISVSIVMVFNAGQLATEKTRLVNAADAAVYSGSVFLARNLNFMAYTNRAMIANHVVVGHLVSYMSWLRYVKNSSNKISRVGRYIPYVNQVLEVVNRSVNGNLYVAEKVAPRLITTIYRLNKSLHRAQKNIIWSMNGVLSVGGPTSVKIMSKIAKKYDASIRINNMNDLNSMRSGNASILAARQVYSDTKNIFSFMKKYTAHNDRGELQRMVDISMGESRQWIRGNRGWEKRIFVINLKKEGYTNSSSNNSITDWSAHDEFTLSRFTWRGWRGTNLGKGSATATEFDRNYKGIEGYYGLRDPARKDMQSLKVSVYATLPMAIMADWGSHKKNGSRRLSALSRAEIYYKRPVKEFNSKSVGEYSNLYNPFWQARLTKNRIENE